MVLECIKVHWSYYQDGWLALLQNHFTGCGTQPPHLQGVVSLNLHIYKVCILKPPHLQGVVSLNLHIYMVWYL